MPDKLSPGKIIFIESGSFDRITTQEVFEKERNNAVGNLLNAKFFEEHLDKLKHFIVEDYSTEEEDRNGFKAWIGHKVIGIKATDSSGNTTHFLAAALVYSDDSAIGFNTHDSEKCSVLVACEPSARFFNPPLDQNEFNKLVAAGDMNIEGYMLPQHFTQ
ncbi:MAG: hypothetical protein AAGF87_14100 [Bacteroidota bacterium]